MSMISPTPYRVGLVGRTIRAAAFIGAPGPPPEPGNDSVLDRVRTDGHAKPRERRHAAVGDAAGDDQAEIVQIGADIEGEPVTGYPAREAHTDRGQFVATHPDAGQARDPRRRDPEIACHPYEDFFEVTHVAVDVATIGIEVNDRVAHDLAGTVVGHIAAASGLEDLDAPGGQHVLGRQNVGTTAVAADAQGQHRRVLDEEQQIADVPRLALGDEGTLQRKRIGIRDQAKPADFDRTHELNDLIVLSADRHCGPIGGSGNRQGRATV
jgi:hypothetical protein